VNIKLDDFHHSGIQVAIYCASALQLPENTILPAGIVCIRDLNLPPAMRVERFSAFPRCSSVLNIVSGFRQSGIA
jgi:hypothetical protein